jgi:hypothetical protein
MTRHLSHPMGARLKNPTLVTSNTDTFQPSLRQAVSHSTVVIFVQIT